MIPLHPDDAAGLIPPVYNLNVLVNDLGVTYYQHQRTHTSQNYNQPRFCSLLFLKSQIFRYDFKIIAYSLR